MITKIHFLKEEIQYAMRIGMLKFSCIIPPDDDKIFGILYIRSIIEKGLSKKDIKKWNLFWVTPNRRGCQLRTVETFVKRMEPSRTSTIAQTTVLSITIAGTMAFF